jgi:dUTP pyrophosphatase
MHLQVKKLHPEAIAPHYALKGDAGMDLYSVEEAVLRPGERRSVSTGIAMKIPEGYVGLVWDKSGVSHKGGVKTLGGVIDSNYLGEYLIGLVNLGDQDFEIRKGQKIAQILIQKVEVPETEEVDDFGVETERGENRFGSTGV